MCEKEGCVCLCVEGVLEGKLCEIECVRGESLWELGERMTLEECMRGESMREKSESVRVERVKGDGVVDGKSCIIGRRV